MRAVWRNRMPYAAVPMVAKSTLHYYLRRIRCSCRNEWTALEVAQSHHVRTVFFSSIGTATPVGFGLLKYRWVFSAGRFLQSAVSNGTSNPQLGGPCSYSLLFFNRHCNPSGFWPAQLSLSILSRKVFTECRCQRHVKPPTWRTMFEQSPSIIIDSILVNLIFVWPCIIK